MGGIATITLNAALDRTLHVDRLERGGKGAITAEWAQAGGKGINVSRALATLGIETRALAVVGGATGRAIAAELEASALPSLCIEAAGESRTCLDIVEPGDRPTRLHGQGVLGDAELVLRVARAIAELPDGFAWIAVCGSLPPGMPAGAVASLGAAARRRGLQVAVDTSGPALAEAWSSAPDLVRINDEELAGALPAQASSSAPSRETPVAGVVSRGARPFDAWDGESRWRVSPPNVEAVNAIGCGDAMMAGLLASLVRGASFPSALRTATALASACAEASRAGIVEVARAHDLEAGVEIEALA